MRRFAAGIAVVLGPLMVVSGLWGAYGTLESGKLLEGTSSLAWAIASSCLIEWGRQHFRRSRLVAIHALKMLSSDGQIDANKLVMLAECPDEIAVRLYVAEQKRRGVLPSDAEPITCPQSGSRVASPKPAKAFYEQNEFFKFAMFLGWPLLVICYFCAMVGKFD